MRLRTSSGVYAAMRRRRSARRVRSSCSTVHSGGITLTDAWPNGAPKVGDVAELSRTVSPTDIQRFTEISGDRNPLHYDVDAAKASRFGEIVVQGGITSAILNAVVAE